MATTKHQDVVVDEHEHPRKNRVDPIDDNQRVVANDENKRQAANQETVNRSMQPQPGQTAQDQRPRRKIENVDRVAIRDQVESFIVQAMAAELEDGQQHTLVITVGPQGYTSTPKLNESVK